jgi:hypothetical protein
MDTRNRRKSGRRRGQKPIAPSRTELAGVIRETTRLWRKHHLSYDQSKYVVEQVRRRIGLAAPTRGSSSIGAETSNKSSSLLDSRQAVPHHFRSNSSWMWTSVKLR